MSTCYSFLFSFWLMWSFASSQEFDGELKFNNSTFCESCILGFNGIIESLNQGENDTTIVDMTIDLCIDLDLGTSLYCDGFIKIGENDILYILNNSPSPTGEDICGTVFLGRGCVSYEERRNWTVTLFNDTKPDINEPPFNNSVNTLKVLHLTDTHYDPYYLPGSNAKCSESLCCRQESGIAETPEDEAGYWGSYGFCDSPPRLIETMYEHIANQHPDISFIIWTGDVVPHDVWKRTREDNIEIIRKTADLISQYFPNVLTFPSLGNHEGNPSNSFAHPNVSDPVVDISWLYDELVDIWSRWFSDANDTIAYGAYYVADVREGLKIISLNGNLCNGHNWWLVYDSEDIGEQLNFLVEELQKSEDDGDSVYIISHIASGYKDCDLSWSREFNKITLRYEDTITGIFYGHTHNDHFQLFLDPNDVTRAYEVAYIAQSQTTFVDLNPGYKIYIIEADENSKFRVLDHENWIMDLELANELNITTFFKLYSARDQYQLLDLSPDSLLNLVKEMDSPDSANFDEFYRNFIKASNIILENGCDETCKRNILCDLLVSDNSDRSVCDIHLSI